MMIIIKMVALMMRERHQTTVGTIDDDISIPFRRIVNRLTYVRS